MVNGIWVRLLKDDWRPRKDVVNNSWFKCSNRILEDEDFYDFKLEEILVWIHILSIASQKKSFVVFINFEAAWRKARLPKELILSAVDKLVGKQIERMETPADDVTQTLRARDGDVTSTLRPRALEGEEGREGEEHAAVPGTRPPASIPSLSQPVFKTAQELEAAIPIQTREKWERAYPDPAWLKVQYGLAFDFHTADQAKIPRTKGRWMQKLHTWLSIGWQKRATEKKAAVPETGGWD